MAAIGGIRSPLELQPEDRPSQEYMKAGMITHMRIRQHFMALPMRDFYRDADIFMRLHAPGMELGELADLDNDQNPGAALRKTEP